MPGLFDLLAGFQRLQQPNPGGAVRSGAPGAQAAPMPTMPPGAPPGAAGPAPVGGPPATPPGPPGGPPGQGQPPQQDQQPPQPKAYQSPQDLGQMYLQLVQQQGAKEGFWRGLAGLAASAYPGRTSPALMQTISGIGQPSEPAGNIFGHLMQLQQYNMKNQLFQQQMDNYNDLLTNADKYAPGLGVSPDTLRMLVKSGGPEGAGEVMGKVLEARMGVTGTQTDKEYRQAVQDFQTRNPGQPLPPELRLEAGFAAKAAADVAESTTTAKDLVANKAMVQHAGPTYDNMVADEIGLLKDPDLNNILGPIGQFKTQGPVTSPDTARVLGKFDTIMARQYAASVPDLKGARVTQTELAKDAPGQSTMSKRGMAPADWREGAMAHIGTLIQKRNLLYQAAGQTPPPVPGVSDFSKMSDDEATQAVSALHPGDGFLGPDNKFHFR
jgi:hypothetical protein